MGNKKQKTPRAPSLKPPSFFLLLRPTTWRVQPNNKQPDDGSIRVMLGKQALPVSHEAEHHHQEQHKRKSSGAKGQANQTNARRGMAASLNTSESKTPSYSTNTQLFVLAKKASLQKESDPPTQPNMRRNQSINNQAQARHGREASHGLTKRFIHSLACRHSSILIGIQGVCLHSLKSDWSIVQSVCVCFFFRVSYSYIFFSFSVCLVWSGRDWSGLLPPARVHDRLKSHPHLQRPQG